MNNPPKQSQSVNSIDLEDIMLMIPVRRGDDVAEMKHAQIRQAINTYISKAELKARLDFAETALRACPTKDHMLRLWLKQSVTTLNQLLGGKP